MDKESGGLEDPNSNGLTVEKQPKDFDVISSQKSGQKKTWLHQKKMKYRPPKQKYKYSGSSHAPQQCPAYEKMCWAVVK